MKPKRKRKLNERIVLGAASILLALICLLTSEATMAIFMAFIGIALLFTTDKAYAEYKL